MNRIFALIAAFLPVLILATELHAQASAYLDPDSWEAEWAERLRIAGGLPGLSAFVRPYREGEVLEALRRADTLRLDSVARVWYGELREELESRAGDADSGPRFWLQVEPGIRGGHRPSLDPFVSERSSGLDPATIFYGWIRWGPAIAVIDARLERENAVEQPVGRETDVEVRVPIAYAALEHGLVRASLGWVPWRLGPRAPVSLVMDLREEIFPAMVWSAGSRRLRFHQWITKLDRIGDSRRFLAVHRLEIRPSDAWEVAFGETVIWSGPGRDWELNKLNPVGSFFLADINQDDAGANINYLFDVAWRPRAWMEVYGEFLLDDFTGLQNFPDRWGSLAGARAEGFLPRLSAEAHFALANAFIYQPLAASPGEFYLYRSLGIATNRSDFNRWTLKLHWDLLPGIRLTPVFDRLRQGPRDLREQIPASGVPGAPGVLSDPAFISTRVGLEGFVQLNQRLTARFELSRLDTDARVAEVLDRDGAETRAWLEVRYRWDVGW